MSVSSESYDKEIENYVYEIPIPPPPPPPVATENTSLDDDSEAETNGQEPGDKMEGLVPTTMGVLCSDDKSTHSQTHEDTSVCDDILSDEEEVKSKPVHQPSLPAETDKCDGRLSYVGMIFYEEKRVEDLVTFASCKDLNALVKYIKMQHPRAELGPHVQFRFMSGYDYVEMKFDTKQEKPCTGWSVRPLKNPCRLLKKHIDEFDGPKHISTLPKCDISVFATDIPNTVPVLHYGIPLEGVDPPVTVYIHRSMRTPTSTDIFDVIIQNKLKESMNEQGSLNIGVSKVIMYGPPAVGKSVLTKRLIGEITNLENETSPNPSDGINPSTNVFICKDIKPTSVLMGDWKPYSDLKEIIKLFLSFLRDSSAESPHIQRVDNSSHRSSSSSTSTGPLPQPAVSPASSELIQPGTTLSPLELPDIVKDSLASGNFQEINNKLKEIDNATFLQIIDIGGQPEFHEIFPLLLSGQAIYLLVINLTQKLDELYKFNFRNKDTSNSRSYTSQFTIQQMLHQILSSIHSLGGKERSAAILIGTYLDKFKKDFCDSDDTIDAVREKAWEKMEKPLIEFMKNTSYYRKMIRESHDGHKLFLIDNINGTFTDEIEPLRKEIEKALKFIEHFSNSQASTTSQITTTSLPTNWAIFYFILSDFPNKSSHNREFCSLKEAKNIAKQLNIKDIDVELVLKHIHNSFCSVLYYNDVCDPEVNGHEDEKKYIFCNPNQLFKAITDFISIFFGPKTQFSDDDFIEKIRKNGIIASDDFDAIFKSFSNSIPLTYLVELLKKCLILSRIENDNANVFYFLPCLLCVRDNPMEIPQACTEVAPLLVGFFPKGENFISGTVSSGYVPPGFFSALCVILSTSSNRWRLNQKNNFKNELKFAYICRETNECSDLLVMSQPHWLEVRLLKNASSTLCNEVYTDIMAAIKKIKDPNTTESMLQLYLKSVSIEVGFHCLDCSQFATKIDEKLLVQCTNNSCSRETAALQDNHKIWFLISDSSFSTNQAITDGAQSMSQQLTKDQLIKLKQILMDVLKDNKEDLLALFNNFIVPIAHHMCQVDIITPAVSSAPTYEEIIKSFELSLGLKKTQQQIEEHCSKFINVLNTVCGPAKDAANTLHDEWTKEANEKLPITLNISVKRYCN